MNNPGLYVHIPFCRTRCAYCDFYSQTDLSLAPDWLDALKREARHYKDLFGSFDSLYLGGGTPTALTPHHLNDLVDFLFKSFCFEENLEFTIEANPDDLSQDYVALLKEFGVNRVSVGIQSLDDKELAFLRRRHSASQAEKAFGRLRKAGIESLSADLIYALPDQRLDTWFRTLNRALSLQPDHLSCYQLTLEKHSPLGVMSARGKIGKTGVEEERRFFLTTSRFLEKEGYLHYEVSNFARQGHLCKHNLKYWNDSPYLGLGPAAHSFDGKARWWNTRSIRRYLRCLSEGRSPMAGKETLSEGDRYLESLLLGFRTRRGVTIDKIRNINNLEYILKQLKESRLVTIQQGKVVPTREGLLHADSLPLLFS
jgi:putative oxygen-independent coproporphyrinogen III oxidase